MFIIYISLLYILVINIQIHVYSLYFLLYIYYIFILSIITKVCALFVLCVKQQVFHMGSVSWYSINNLKAPLPYLKACPLPYKACGQLGVSYICIFF